MYSEETINAALAQLRRQHRGRPKVNIDRDNFVVQQYLESNPFKIWWFAHEVTMIDTPFGYISHRGGARLTDLVDSGVCVRDKVGRFTVYRLK